LVTSPSRTSPRAGTTWLSSWRRSVSPCPVTSYRLAPSPPACRATTLLRQRIGPLRPDRLLVAPTRIPELVQQVGFRLSDRPAGCINLPGSTIEVPIVCDGSVRCFFAVFVARSNVGAILPRLPSGRGLRATSVSLLHAGIIMDLRQATTSAGSYRRCFPTRATGGTSRHQNRLTRSSSSGHFWVASQGRLNRTVQSTGVHWRLGSRCVPDGT